jgi:excisionase family DNA binding protein
VSLGAFLRWEGSLRSKPRNYTGEPILAQIMTTKEMAKYLKLHQITVCKLCKEGKIPSIRIGRVWRFDRDVIDEWIAGVAEK